MFFSKRVFNPLSNSSRCSGDSFFLMPAPTAFAMFPPAYDALLARLPGYCKGDSCAAESQTKKRLPDSGRPGKGMKLIDQAHHVVLYPAFHDFAVSNTNHRETCHNDRSSSWGNSKDSSLMIPPDCDERTNFVSLGNLIFD